MDSSDRLSHTLTSASPRFPWMELGWVLLGQFVFLSQHACGRTAIFPHTQFSVSLDVNVRFSQHF